jgi:uncharacterized protein VirK/YbjX
MLYSYLLTKLNANTREQTLCSHYTNVQKTRMNSSTHLLCITSQKSKDLIYAATAASNHASINLSADAVTCQEKNKLDSTTAIYKPKAGE